MWLAIGFAAYKGRKKMRLIRRPGMELPKPAPKVTVLIPAKDEGARIRACIESALGQDYPDFEVITVNDRSSDDTGRVMDEMAKANPRLRVIHIKDGELREGWTGKNNALHTAVSHASGEWYLFVDSDVILQPDALRTALAFSAAKNVALFSLFPKLESHTIWESLTVPLAGTAVSILYLVAMTNNDHWPGAFANGQFLLFNADAYNAIGGHAAVRTRFCEDVEFARLVKPMKRRCGLPGGRNLRRCGCRTRCRVFCGGGRGFFMRARWDGLGGFCWEWLRFLRVASVLIRRWGGGFIGWCVRCRRAILMGGCSRHSCIFAR